MARRKEFDAFQREYLAWWQHTLTLPIRQDGHVAASAFELDLDHLIDYVRSVASEGAAGSTKYDYPLVALHYLADLGQVQSQLAGASLDAVERHTYVTYLSTLTSLLTHLGSLPVPPEGHLGFRSAALKAFGFLVDEYGFEIVKSSPISLRFATESLFVDLSHSPQNPAGSVSINRNLPNDDVGADLVLDDFAYVDRGDVMFDYGEFDLRERSDLARFLTAAAAMIRRRGSLLLTGDPAAFHQLRIKAGERERAYIELMERQQSDSSQA